MSAGEIAFRIGRRIGKHPLAGRMFCLTERLLPLNRLARRDGLVVFHHPRPIADPHILIVPAEPIESLTTDRLSDDQRAKLIWRMISLGREVASQLPARNEWQMVINGGTRQDIGQMHAHVLHADGHSVIGRSLKDPSIEPKNWKRIHRELRDAERIQGNGFSLVVQWAEPGDAVAEVTQTMRT